MRSTELVLLERMNSAHIVQTANNARSPDRKARRDAMYTGVRSCWARNPVTSNLYSVRYFTGNQWNCCSAAAKLRRSPRLTHSPTLAAERCATSRWCKTRSDMPYRTAFPESSPGGTREWARVLHAAVVRDLFVFPPYEKYLSIVRRSILAPTCQVGLKKRLDSISRTVGDSDMDDPHT